MQGVQGVKAPRTSFFLLLSEEEKRMIGDDPCTPCTAFTAGRGGGWTGTGRVWFDRGGGASASGRWTRTDIKLTLIPNQKSRPGTRPHLRDRVGTPFGCGCGGRLRVRVLDCLIAVLVMGLVAAVGRGLCPGARAGNSGL